MNTRTTRNRAFGILCLIGVLAFGGCSKEPTTEEIAAQVRAVMAEEKAKEQVAASAPVPAAESATPVPAAPVAAAKPAPRPRSVAKSRPAPVQAEPAAPAQPFICANCGVVISVNEIELAGKGSGVGAIAGGVAGGVLGHQVGQGKGRDLATVAGAVGGAVAGHKIEENVKKTKVYDVAVRMDNGEERILRHETAPGVLAGDKVRVEGDLVVKQ